MNYTRIHIAATPEQQEMLISQLSEADAIGFEQDDDFLLAYFNEEGFNSYEVNQVLSGYTIELTTVPEKNWNEEWESNFQPVIVDDFCGIRAHFHEPLKDVKHEILITPKMSFGTGHHATTFMMIREMKNLVFENKSVFDFGTGTGVLAILAEKLGAARVTAIDNDHWSIENTLENLAANHCQKVNAFLSEDLPEEQFDVILANINRNIILEYMAGLANALKPGGQVLFSGLLVADKSVILEAATAQSFEFQAQQEKNGWISLLFTVSEKRVL